MNDETERTKEQISKKVRAAIILIIVAIFGLIFGQSILKNDNFKNASANFEDTSVTNRQLSVATGSQSLDCSASTSEHYVHIGGMPIGIAIKADGLIVVGEGGVKTSDGEIYPSRGKLQVGDIIKTVDGEKVSSIYQLKKILSDTKGNVVTLQVQRNGVDVQVDVVPAVERITGQKKLGIALKEDIGGIGTLTFVTENGEFAALGHYISDGESGLGEELDSGNIYKTSIESVDKGEIGRAGGLVAGVNRLSTPIGSIKSNTNIGLYGVYSAKIDSKLIKVAAKGEAKPGHAQVLTTVEGAEPKLYDIEIVKVISQNSPGDKGMVIMISDKELLSKTGGIVQGMSGSPIIQNGVLIGAVTHVFIQDPTRGYAVHARFMLDEAERVAGEKNENFDNQTLPNIEDFDVAA